MGSTSLLGGSGGMPLQDFLNLSALRLILTTFSRYMYLTITTVEHITAF